MVSVVWFRDDLRLKNNETLQAALQTKKPVVCIYIDDQTQRPRGGASKWWLHHSLLALETDLKKRGARLFYFKGESEAVFEEIIKEVNLTHVFWTRRYTPRGIATDRHMKAWLKAQGIQAKSTAANYLIEPHTLLNASQKPFQVFTPFWNRVKSMIPERASFSEIDGESISSVDVPSKLSLEELHLKPDLPWAETFHEYWTPGEKGAKERLQTFIKTALDGYKTNRNIPSIKGTSGLSPHLHFGEISIHDIYDEALAYGKRHPDKMDDVACFLSELGWRDFSAYLLFHEPSIIDQPLKKVFLNFAWNDSEDDLKAWQKGLTGYPIVDAGMRQLWQTGWMHNRVRMIAASFLVKDLLLPWQMGEEWFWDTLVDADSASNAASWQWVAGSGADAAPYFRIFSPVRQGETFDPDGHYIRTFVPELKDMPNAYIHKPWEAPPEILRDAGVKLGQNYPNPMVDHAKARVIALERYKNLRS